VQKLLAKQCERAGGLSAFAATHGLTKQYISYVLRGERSPGRKLCEALGIRSDGERWVKRAPRRTDRLRVLEMATRK
jgi:hypothetical protein